jgi:hypothetical protein
LPIRYNMFRGPWGPFSLNILIMVFQRVSLIVEYWNHLENFVQTYWLCFIMFSTVCINLRSCMLWIRL